MYLYKLSSIQRYKNKQPTHLVAHLYFLPTHKSTLKNSKELPSLRTTTDLYGQTNTTEKEQRTHNRVVRPVTCR